MNSLLKSYPYSTAHIQVYKKTRVTLCASRKFDDNSRWARATREVHCSQVIADELKILASNSCRALLYSQVITEYLCVNPIMRVIHASNH